MIKGLIWDKDGVLLNMEPLYCQTGIKVLGRHGIKLTARQYYEHWTKNGKGLSSFLEERGVMADIAALRKEWSDVVKACLRENVPVINGAANALTAFYGIYPQSLVTSSHRDSTDLSLELSGLARYFRHVIAVEDVSQGKPDPEGFLLASRRMGLEPSRLLVIEDAEKGVKAAYAAGMKCIAIPNQYTSDNDFSRATIVLNDIMQLTPELVRRL